MGRSLSANKSLPKKNLYQTQDARGSWADAGLRFLLAP